MSGLITGVVSLNRRTGPQSRVEPEVVSLRVGDLVEVKSPSEIAETLDPDGTRNGLPFMPEMLKYCGHRFRVLQHTQKTCVEIGAGAFFIRAFSAKDVLLLEGLRCSGKSHDGCQRLCMIFWKAAWLRAVEPKEPAAVVSRRDLEKLERRLKTKSAPGRYFCQSTQLLKITQSLKRGDTISQAVRDLRSGAIGVVKMTVLIALPLFRKVRNRLFGRPRLLGTQSRTPVENLGLLPGETVRVKSLEEMRATLDTAGRNRGLVCDIELAEFCGKEQKVLTRLDRMICESTGEMKNVEATVFLHDAPCLCSPVFGGCPRRDFTYFREIWLKRVDPLKHSRNET